MRHAGHEVGPGGKLTLQDLKGWLRSMKQWYPGFDVDLNGNKQQLLEEASRVLQQQHATAAAAAAVAQQLLSSSSIEEASGFMQSLQAAWEASRAL
mmetsp:Transcript_12527/g.34204  ORF Transcript_12527/g.34204 Transcript_12527/m.34204 type:complete len:96 (+) Transcript_12527:96-383(+)